MKTADEIKVVSDECGFKLHLVDTNGDEHRFNIHGVAWAFETNVRDTIGGWKAEGEAARSSMPRLVTVDDLDGYEIGDPKRVELQRIIDRGGV